MLSKEILDQYREYQKKYPSQATQELLEHIDGLTAKLNEAIDHAEEHLHDCGGYQAACEDFMAILKPPEDEL